MTRKANRRIAQSGKKRIIAILLLTAMLPAFLVLTGMSLPMYYKDSYYAELAPMAENLPTARGKRVVILGSSNVAFGVNSALLEELLSRKGFDYRARSVAASGWRKTCCVAWATSRP